VLANGSPQEFREWGKMPEFRSGLRPPPQDCPMLGAVLRDVNGHTIDQRRTICGGAETDRAPSCRPVLLRAARLAVPAPILG